jgi:hypothetical protein
MRTYCKIRTLHLVPNCCCQLQVTPWNKDTSELGTLLAGLKGVLTSQVSLHHPPYMVYELRLTSLALWYIHTRDAQYLLISLLNKRRTCKCSFPVHEKNRTYWLKSWVSFVLLLLTDMWFFPLTLKVHVLHERTPNIIYMRTYVL